MDSEWGYENSEWGEDGEEHGTIVPVVYPYLHNNDIERFILSLPYDEGRVLVVRALGFEGKRAAELAGFKSIWVYIRKLKKLQARMKASIGVAF